MRAYILKIITIFMMMLPIFDGLTYIFKTNSLTIGIIVKMLFLGFLGLFSIIKYRGKHLKRMIVVVISTALFIITFTYFNSDGDMFRELSDIVKLFYLPLLLICYYCVKEVCGKWIPWTLVTNVALFYAIVIIVTTVLGFATHTFTDSAIRFGSKGIYYAANDIGIILGIGISVLVMEKMDKLAIIKLIILFIGIAFLGVKTPVFMLLLTLVYVIVKLLRRGAKTSVIVGMLLVIVAVGVYLPNSNIRKNIEVHANYVFSTEKYDVESVEDMYKDSYIVLNEFVLSNRLEFANEMLEVFQSGDLDDNMFGIGFAPYKKDVEMDGFDLIFRTGIIGTAFYITVLVYGLKLHIEEIGLNNKTFIMLMILITSMIVGHVIFSVSVSLITALIVSKRENIESVV